MKNNHNNIINSLESSSNSEHIDKKQKTDSVLERELVSTKEQLKSTEEQLKSSQDEVAEWKLKYLQLQLMMTQSKKYLSNKALILQVLRDLSFPDKIHVREKSLLIDMNHGKGKWHSDEISALFDNVKLYDAFFNKEYKNDHVGEYRHVGTYDELELKAMSSILADIVFSDNPYIQRSGFHNGLNSSMASESIKEMDRNYGLIGFRFPRRFLLLLMLQHLRYAERLLKVGGFLLLKSKQHGFNLNDPIIEASIGTCLQKIGELTFPTTPVDESDMMTLACSDNHDVTQLILFQKCSTPVNTGRYFYPNHIYLTLTDRIKILSEQSRIELVAIGQKKLRRRNIWRSIANNILTYLMSKLKIDDDGVEYEEYVTHRIKRLGKEQMFLFGYSPNVIVWKSDTFPINWNEPHRTNSWPMLTLQQNLMNESQRQLDVINICCVMFTEVLTLERVSERDDEQEMSNNHRRRRTCLDLCNIPIDYHTYFLNGTIKRMLQNAKNIKGFQSERSFLGVNLARFRTTYVKG